MHPQMTSYKVAICRGGTSKGIFINRNELPKDPMLRDKVIRAIFGSPDKRQIDGLGGADVLTSKLAIIGPPSREDADVDYTFGQVSFDSDTIDYNGNCGNISSAVGPYAIDEGIVDAKEPVTRVRIYQTNTDCILIADVPVEGGKACVEGDCKIDGVPGTGARIMLNFFDTAGSTTGRVLPTGNAVDKVHTEKFGDFEVSIVDAGNVVVFIEAESFGLKGTESCAEIESNKELMEKIEAVRAAATVKAGLVSSAEDATKYRTYAPFFAIVSKPAAYISAIDGKKVQPEDVDIVSRLYFMLHMHKTYPGTGTVCTGAAALIPGTLVHKQLKGRTLTNNMLRIGHPGGIISVEAKLAADCKENGELKFETLAYERTARRIMEGNVYIRNEVLK
ncbi:MAG: 2-methylaconitate cis-trans isomerase PrpF family protein [Lutisporaceae bacterium]|jgi:2-methylaconitate cis-trans-isomerase PrpF